MTILITGATGLVGARLLPRLINAGHPCRVLIRPGKTAPAGAEPAEGDLMDAAALALAVQGVTAVVHMAAVFRTPDADLVWQSNLEGTRNLISAVKAHAPAARFIMASTSNIYNADSAHPGREGDAAAPAQPYPASKLAAEALLRESGMAWAVLRLGFVYGDKDGHLEELPALAARFGMHPAKRMSMIHHRDVATAVQLALSGAVDGHVVNIADDAPTSLYELAGLVGSKIDGAAEPLENPWHLHMDIALSRSLGFQPSVRSVHQAAFEGLL